MYGTVALPSGKLQPAISCVTQLSTSVLCADDFRTLTSLAAPDGSMVNCSVMSSSNLRSLVFSYSLAQQSCSDDVLRWNVRSIASCRSGVSAAGSTDEPSEPLDEPAIVDPCCVEPDCSAHAPPNVTITTTTPNTFRMVTPSTGCQ